MLYPLVGKCQVLALSNHKQLFCINRHHPKCSFSAMILLIFHSAGPVRTDFTMRAPLTNSPINRPLGPRGVYPGGLTQDKENFGLDF